MEAATIQDQRYTKQEYFELLRSSQHKYEYLDGRVRLMAGGTAAHNDIVGNTYFALRSGTKTCQVKNSETAIATANRYVFPDASAVCEDEALYEQGGIARLINPALVVEVISESSDPYDRTEKFSAYRRLPSLREYLLIDSRRYLVETYYREERDLWRIGNYFDLDQQIEVKTLGISVPMAVFYEGVDFS
ncbi:Uma2 family endonuclease [Neolewinella sp.]|uniref:Uma2 family endonuclease n=1 Tax=Neolewinella sp. TaxID=2993543 RepID=UPI003B51AF8E